MTAPRPTRRESLLAAGALVMPTAWAAEPGAALAQTLKRGPPGVLMFRHALAPGTFDPPGFRLGDCSTQRKLNDEGRQQARQIGAWFTAQGLRPTRVRSSPWCRCMDTARLAFGEPVDTWPALGSPRAGSEEVNAQALVALQGALRKAVQGPAGFEVWVTHMFVFAAFLREGARSGEAVWLGLQPDGTPRVLERLAHLAR